MFLQIHWAMSASTKKLLRMFTGRTVSQTHLIQEQSRKRWRVDWISWKHQEQIRDSIIPRLHNGAVVRSAWCKQIQMVKDALMGPLKRNIYFQGIWSCCGGIGCRDCLNDFIGKKPLEEPIHRGVSVAFGFEDICMSLIHSRMWGGSISLNKFYFQLAPVLQKGATLTSPVSLEFLYYRSLGAVGILPNCPAKIV